LVESFVSINKIGMGEGEGEGEEEEGWAEHFK
jgi:hypothetical protein